MKMARPEDAKVGTTIIFHKTEDTAGQWCMKEILAADPKPKKKYKPRKIGRAVEWPALTIKQEPGALSIKQEPADEEDLLRAIARIGIVAVFNKLSNGEKQISKDAFIECVSGLKGLDRPKEHAIEFTNQIEFGGIGRRTFMKFLQKYAKAAKETPEDSDEDDRPWWKNARVRIVDLVHTSHFNGTHGTVQSWDGTYGVWWVKVEGLRVNSEGFLEPDNHRLDIMHPLRRENLRLVETENMCEAALEADGGPLDPAAAEERAAMAAAKRRARRAAARAAKQPRTRRTDEEIEFGIGSRRFYFRSIAKLQAQKVQCLEADLAALLESDLGVQLLR